MTNQSDLQASVRALTGTALDYNGDFMALFDGAGIAKTDFNGRLLAWINLTLGTTYTEINGAKQAYAAALGFFNWNSLNTIDPNPGSIVELLFVGPGTPAIPFYKVNGVVYADPSLIPGWSFTRASTKTAQTSSGLVVSFASGVPAITDLGFLVEEARTNDFLQSNFAGTWGTNGGATAITTGATVSPDNTSDAAKLTANSTLSTFYWVDQLVSTPTGTVWTFSVYAKQAELRYLWIDARDQTFTNGGTAIYDLQTGLQTQTFNTGTGSVTSAPNCTPAANGFYRCIITVTQTGAVGAHVRLGWTNSPTSTGPITGVVGSGIYAYGFQGGPYSFETSLVPTTSSAATRAADVAFLAVVPSGPSYTLIEKALYPATWVANAVFAEGATAVSGTLKGATISTGSISGFLRLLQRSGMARGDTDGSNPSIGASAQFTAAMSTDGTTTAFSVNGATATSGATPAQADWSGGISIGSRTGSSNWANTSIKSLTLSNAAASQAVLNGRTQ